MAARAILSIRSSTSSSITASHTPCAYFAVQSHKGERERKLLKSIMFIAIQCCECSTMQVKQRKKSSNKWCCVVCGQKQSLTKVFAQGLMAKDVRPFVQSFNMSRQFSDQNSRSETLDPVLDDSSIDQFPINHRKRTDWTEYIDPEENCRSEEEKENNEFEPKIVTELPESLFKKPKLSVSARRSYNKTDVKLLKPVFSKKKSSHSQAMEVEAEEQPKGSMPIQKKEINEKNSFIEFWEQILSEDNNDTCKFSERDKEGLNMGGRFVDLDGHLDESLKNAIVSDQRVEDEVHPEFM
ncbi:uncharacterized protein LOC124924439 [Impatiens glandulifera]|uniref:uncharacterized protein LOC124924439 n=1 Tax=Impatiens glandulifera TaxID=253017 RepID=UPI001FB18153|nr:uncharacterized protein LOC124924439 [Impatiens glandulifera]